MNRTTKTATVTVTRDQANARTYADALTCAALNMIDCKGLTPNQTAKAEQIYELASSLESSLTEESES